VWVLVPWKIKTKTVGFLISYWRGQYSITVQQNILYMTFIWTISIQEIHYLNYLKASLHQSFLKNRKSCKIGVVDGILHFYHDRLIAKVRLAIRTSEARFQSPSLRRNCILRNFLKRSPRDRRKETVQRSQTLHLRGWNFLFFKVHLSPSFRAKGTRNVTKST